MTLSYAELDVTTRTIRFYESKGLIAPARRGVARSYSRRDRARLMLILRGKNLGFSLEAIGEYLKLYDADPAHIAQTQMLLAGVEEAIENLQTKRADLDKARHISHDGGRTATRLVSIAGLGEPPLPSPPPAPRCPPELDPASDVMSRCIENGDVAPAPRHRPLRCRDDHDHPEDDPRRRR